MTKNAAFLSSRTAWAAIWRAKWPAGWRLTRCAKWPRGTKAFHRPDQKTVLGAHERIYQRAQGNAECAGMGTTLSMLCRGAGYIYIAHVGDSRIYRLRGGRMEQLTQDHSLVGELVRAGILTAEEARTHPRRNIITRALGTEGDNTPDLLAADLQPGDRFLLCTDGLTGMVRDDEIERTLLDSQTADEAADRLIQMALDAGGSDNVTLILCTGEEGKPWKQD
ncbi:MAG: protein phosphatase 2C domain-containing protein [Christensenellales bacterium]